MQSFQKVSVIMPMRNAQAYVAKAIASILEQSHRALELIVIDDQSTDQSRAIVEKMQTQDSRLQLVNGDGVGIAAAKNMGLNHVTGEVVMFCDADDYYPRTRLQTQMAWLQLNPDAGAVCGSFAMTDHRGENSIELASGSQSCEITGELLSGVTRTHLCTFAIRRWAMNVMNTAGGFRGFFVSAEDIDFQLRLAEVCPVYFETPVTYFSRQHDTSIVHTQASARRVFYEETARAFRRQRAAAVQDDLQSGNPPAIPAEIGQRLCARDQIQGALLSAAWDLRRHGEKRAAITKAFQAFRVNPGNLRVGKSLIMLMIK